MIRKTSCPYNHVRLGDILEFSRNGLTVKQSAVSDGLPITRIETIYEGEVDLGRVGYGGIEKKGNEKWLLRRGDILFSHINSIPYLGKCAIFDRDEEVIHGMNLLCLRPMKSVVYPKYLLYAIRTGQFRRQLEKYIKPAVNQASLAISDIKTIEIPMPPLSGQRRIAAILDKADAIRRKRQQAIQLADEFLRSVFLDMFGDPARNPKAWPKGTIRDLVSEVKYGTSKKANKTNGKYPILRMNNITYQGDLDLADLKYVDLGENEETKYLAKKGDLLFNRTNSKDLVGKTTVYDLESPMAIAGYLIRVRSNNKSNPYYISAYLNSKHGKTTLYSICKNIIGMANINAQELQDIGILIPPVHLQNQYAEIVNNVKQKRATLIKSLDDSITLAKSLTQRAFRGEL